MVKFDFFSIATVKKLIFYVVVMLGMFFYYKVDWLREINNKFRQTKNCIFTTFNKGLKRLKKAFDFD